MHAIRTSLSSFWQHGRPIERTAYAVGALLFFSGVVHLTILLVTGSTWLGPLSLRKPMSFGLSFGLTALRANPAIPISVRIAIRAGF
jgi:hypothetical protein